MIRIRKAKDRGHFDHGWLQTWHSFSFGDYQDRDHMGFRTLRVLNEDIVQAGQGFGTHGHRDMEILTWVLSGALEHKDSMGNGSIIRPGDAQRMTAGTGVLHSEFNPSADEPTHLLQIWILPQERGLEPGYEERRFAADELTGKLRCIAAPAGDHGAVTIHQDARVFVARLAAGQQVVHDLAPGRHAWVQVARGAVSLNGTALAAGDGAAASDERSLALRAVAPAEVLVFDLG